MAWRDLDRKLNEREYAKELCKEIGWPYSPNVNLFSDCITSLSHLHHVDTWQAFVILMEAIEYAKKHGITLNRWFFTDAKYNHVRDLAPKREPKSSISNPAFPRPVNRNVM